MMKEHHQKIALFFILPDNYKKDCKLPTTYEEDEIRELIASVERASPIGKRGLSDPASRYRIRMACKRYHPFFF